MDPAAALRDICDRALATRIAPGGVIALADDHRLQWEFPFGTTADDDDGGAAVTERTIYDLASLTKPIATTALTMRAVAAGDLTLAERACRWLPELDRDDTREVTIAQLVGHAAGFPAHIRFYEDLFADPANRNRRSREAADALLELALAASLETPAGTRAAYSDVGYILLGAILERLHGARLDALVAAQVTGPLALDSITYGADASAADVAPTERVADRDDELLVGVVHDENARAGGGVSGHAGLFGTAADVLGFALEMLAAASGAENRLISPEVARTFLTTSAAPGTSWKLGWDTPSPLPARSHAGDHWPRDGGFGHLGFTGTSMWLAPERGRAVVILTNRVYYSREPPLIRGFRREVMDAIATALPW